ncbi:MAG: P-type DNA transfer ATPase VirB11 [Coxiellaceae bacterium]|nr:P-type DNA transfer ATPase VirB11 [Coxiellaceae bacterium]|tara:strand:- start:200 stop:1180 length:981 start_codon:yes stop_codon:yes gene_type:complete
MLYGPSSSGLLTPIQCWLDDESVSEIMINRPKEVWVESYGKMSRHTVDALNDYHLHHFMQLIANENNSKLDSSSPILSSSLLDGTRIQCVIPPITKHPICSIRRRIVKDVSLTDFFNPYHQPSISNEIPLSKKNNSYNISTDFKNLQSAIKEQKNIVISGGTSSGKTTLLNACLKMIDNKERIITIEDAREIDCANQNQVNLLVHHSGDLLTSIPIQELVKSSLRLRPDRIIIGEIRGKEILDYLNAAATGHKGCMTTIHAGTPQTALIRMKQLYKLNSVPSMTDQDILDEMYHVIDLIVQVKKTPVGRLVTDIVTLDANGHFDSC